MSNFTFTSESVTEGHPDKMADQISDSILDAMLEQDPMSRVACETLVTTGLCMVAGEITTEAYVDIPSVVRDTINGIGYDRESFGYDGSTCGVMVSIDEQSPDIAQGVDTSEEVRAGTSGEDQTNEQGAGDQGMMFGYACNETDVLMPLPIHVAHRMAERLAEVRRAGTVPYLRPDGKTQVSFDYEDGKPVRLRTVLVSTQHDDGIERDEVIRPDLIEHVIRPVIPEAFADDDYEVFVNPTGRFVIGGPVGDAGLTGRKIIVDTYGGMPSASLTRSRSWSRPSAPRTSTGPRSTPPCVTCSTCARPPSSRRSSCDARSSSRPPPTATSAARVTGSPGSGRTASTT